MAETARKGGQPMGNGTEAIAKMTPLAWAVTLSRKPFRAKKSETSTSSGSPPKVRGTREVRTATVRALRCDEGRLRRVVLDTRRGAPPYGRAEVEA